MATPQLTTNTLCKEDFSYSYCIVFVEECDLCHSELYREYGRKWYAHTSTTKGKDICSPCYNQLRSLRTCIICNLSFESGNKLSKHLRS